jgi:septum formation protein
MMLRKYILGSRSPRRLELLQLLAPQGQITVLPPKSSAEDGFDGLDDEATIARRLEEIVQAKRRALEEQLSSEQRQSSLRLVADTIVVVGAGAGRLRVLGQPPDGPGWEITVRDWFERYYSGRVHTVWTGLCLWEEGRTLTEEIVKTTVRFRTLTAEEIDWYLATRESHGKAGGYGLQGLASVLIESVEGSLSNVVGLPLEALRPFIP